MGIALALLGNFNLAAAAAGGGRQGDKETRRQGDKEREVDFVSLSPCLLVSLSSPPNVSLSSPPDTAPVPLLLDDLVAKAHLLNPVHLKVAFLFLLVGYGTKMGLAPMHTWLPDAHSESPSLVSALLSGALLNCAFLGILRAHQVCIAAGLADFTSELLVGFGLLSMAVAAVFIIAQANYKRMLAYSSVEHMGILSLGVGLGGAGVFGAMLHALNHSMTKASLFLVAGNILHCYHTKDIRRRWRYTACAARLGGPLGSWVSWPSRDRRLLACSSANSSF